MYNLVRTIITKMNHYQTHDELSRKLDIDRALKYGPRFGGSGYYFGGHHYEDAAPNLKSGKSYDQKYTTDIKGERIYVPDRNDSLFLGQGNFDLKQLEAKVAKGAKKVYDYVSPYYEKIFGKKNSVETIQEPLD